MLARTVLFPGSLHGSWLLRGLSHSLLLLWRGLWHWPWLLLHRPRLLLLWHRSRLLLYGALGWLGPRHLRLHGPGLRLRGRSDLRLGGGSGLWFRRWPYLWLRGPDLRLYRAGLRLGGTYLWLRRLRRSQLRLVWANRWLRWPYLGLSGPYLRLTWSWLRWPYLRLLTWA